MASIREVKQRIYAVEATRKMTNAMKMVAAAKFNQAQNKILHYRPYAKTIQKLCVRLLQNESPLFFSKYMNEKTSLTKKYLFVLVASDRGLCGSFNTHIYKTYQHYINNNNNNTIEILPIGKKIAFLLKKQQQPVIESYVDMISTMEEKKVIAFTNFLVKNFKKKYDNIFFIYNKFQNAANQTPTLEQFLPFQMPSQKPSQKILYHHYIYETQKKAMIQKIIGDTLQARITKILLESNVSEHGARMTAMNKATDNAEEMLKTLHLYYNRTRQAVITNEISEIVAGASSL